MQWLLWLLVFVVLLLVGYITGGMIQQETTMWWWFGISGALSVLSFVMSFAMKNYPEGRSIAFNLALVFFGFMAMIWVGYDIATENIYRATVSIPPP